jgi:hypothetical protein
MFMTLGIMGKTALPAYSFISRFFVLHALWSFFIQAKHIMCVCIVSYQNFASLLYSAGCLSVEYCGSS